MQIADERTYTEVIAAAGATFQGIQYGRRGVVLILFADPRDGSTLAVHQSEFTLEAVLRRLDESR